MLEDAMESLDITIGATYKGWSERQSALIQKISSVTWEIGEQQKAYNKYMEQANSVGLSDIYKYQVETGSFKIAKITDEDLAKKINEYKSWYDKAVEAKKAIEKLRDEEAKLYKQRFENYSDLYDKVVG